MLAQGNTSTVASIRGGGILNSIINKLPVELHIPGYQFCGPGTKLDKRLARGEKGINPLDRACREHDIAYRDNKTLDQRHEADRRLEDTAWERVKAKDSSLGEKTAAWLVTNAMKAKRKLGMGHKRKGVGGKSRRKRRGGSLKSKSGGGGGKQVTFQKGIVKRIANDLPKNTDSLREAARLALKGARIAVKSVGGKRKVKIPRTIPIPVKRGGILPLLPAIFAGLSALSALSGGAAGVYRAVKKTQEAKDKMKEAERHNKAMEDIAIGKTGSGIYIKRYKKGLGIYLTKKKKTQKNF
ncbi:uncharacterized protein [Onthophagus taurus]|uniref:uncharacterized protein n=1 Tax=Onthophagus taurus TaxID=166361 RepID=UPI0039BE4165